MPALTGWLALLSTGQPFPMPRVRGRAGRPTPSQRGTDQSAGSQRVARIEQPSRHPMFSFDPVEGDRPPMTFVDQEER